MFKLVLEKAEEQEIKLPTLLDHRKCKRVPENICFIDYAKAFDCVDHNKLWKILQEMGIPDHLTCLQKNLDAGQEATVRTRHGTMDWFQIGKGVHQGRILSLCLFKLYAEYIMINAGLDKARGIPEKTSTFVLLTMQKPLNVWITTNCGKFLKG